VVPVSGTPALKEISTVPAEKPSPIEQKGAVFSPMQGMVLRLLVKPGQKVQKGKPVVVLEAMKMEMPVEAPHDGEVKEIFVFESEMINAGDLIMIVQ
jgi:biotin carboxyl carrier protein